MHLPSYILCFRLVFVFLVYDVPMCGYQLTEDKGFRNGQEIVLDSLLTFDVCVFILTFLNCLWVSGIPKPCSSFTSNLLCTHTSCNSKSSGAQSLCPVELIIRLGHYLPDQHALLLHAVKNECLLIQDSFGSGCHHTQSLIRYGD